MCGICGIFNFDFRKKAETEDIEKMLLSISYRGPDDQGIFIKNNFGFGNCRLSIIDIKGGFQPIFNEDKTLAIVFNGEIYNFLALRKDLEKKGHRFTSRTDTEVILHLYEELRERCLNKLDGMFALAIWDIKKDKLFLARDPMGKKPLYWVSFGGKFVFASEPKAILALPEFRKEIDHNSLAKYFFYGYVPSPNTIFKGMKRLSAGSWLEVDKRGVGEEKKFWEIDYSQKIDSFSEDEVKKRIVFLLEKSIEKRLIADVPIGIFLSGGIDSSLIAALIPDKKMEAFTIGFEDKKIDESPSAKKIAAYLGIKQNLRIFSDEEVLSILPRALKLMDEPNADPSILPTYLVSSFAREKVKVVLSGDGGDESFAGYPKYLAHFLLEETPLKYFLPLYSLGQPRVKFWSFLKYARLPLELRNQLWLSSLSTVEVENLTSNRLEFEDIYQNAQIFNGKEMLDKAFFLDQKMTLADQFLVKVDRASMANSLEVRCPFLDKELVSFAAMIPSKMKIKNFRTKFLLREIAKEVLPKEVINSPKKGFGVPLKKWLNTELKPLIDGRLLPKKIKKEGVLNAEIVSNILKMNNYDAVWKLLIFEIWLENWIL